ncbi:MAG: phytanoyl-CoA dioxygenase family protein [Fuerstiella sp.]
MSVTGQPCSVEYQREGFLIAESLLSDKALQSLRDRMTDIAAGRVPGFPKEDIEYEPGEQRDAGVPTIRKINRCAENDAVFMAVARQPEILDIVESLLGPDIKLFGSQCFMKPPGGIEKPYHQDSAYFTVEPRALVTCWIALDDVTIQNGCMWVVPGSHRGELHDHSQPWDVGGRVDMQVPDEKIDRSQETPIIMSAGSCSFHHSMLLHRSGRNQTDTHRRGLAIHYMSAESRWTHPSLPQPSYLLLRGREYPGCV